MLRREETEKGVEKFQIYICDIKRKIIEIDNKYDDVNKLIQYNIVKNRVLNVAMTTCDLLDSLNLRLREARNFACKIKEIVEDLNNKIENLKD